MAQNRSEFDDEWFFSDDDDFEAYEHDVDLHLNHNADGAI